MKLPKQANSTVRASIISVHASNLDKVGVHPAACCPGDNRRICREILGYVNCPQGFACRLTSICNNTFGCIPFGFCIAQNFTIGFG